MPARKVIAGKCGRCAQRNHCDRCVCCDGAPFLLDPYAGQGFTRTFAYVACGPNDAHTGHYVKRTRTHRIPDGGKVRLRWRDRMTTGVAPIAHVTVNEAVARTLAAVHARWAMQAHASHAHTL